MTLMDLINTFRFSRSLADHEIERLRSLPYRDYLKSDWWQYKRKRLLAVRGRRCELCGETKRIEVHHTTYENLGQERAHELVVVCHRCHQHLKRNGLDRTPRHVLLANREIFLHSPEFGLDRTRLDY